MLLDSVDEQVPEGTADRDHVIAAIRRCRESLIDRSRSNPLVHIGLGLSQKSHLRFVSGSIDGLAASLASGSEIKPSVREREEDAGASTENNETSDPHAMALTGHCVPTCDLTPIELDKRLTTLARKARTRFAETGVNPLSLVLGILRWRESALASSAEFNTPIIVVPASITKEVKANRYVTTITATCDDVYELNPALTERIKTELGVIVPQPFEGETPATYLGRLSALLAEAHVSAEVVPYALVTALPSAKLALWKDLDPDSWGSKGMADHPLVKALLSPEIPHDAAVNFSRDHDVDAMSEAATGRLPQLVFDADSSQFSALIDVAAGKSMAIEGPPGTGKSQTIANIIADAAANGRTVLFVAEKQAALEVVTSRLTSKGLSPLMLHLGTSTSDRVPFIESLRERLDLEAFGRDQSAAKRRESSIDHAALLQRSKASGIAVEGNLDLDAAMWMAARLKATFDPSHLNSVMETQIESAPTMDIAALGRAAQDLVDVEAEEVPGSKIWAGLYIGPDHEYDLVAASAGALARRLDDLHAVPISLMSSAPLCRSRIRELGRMMLPAERIPLAGHELEKALDDTHALDAEQKIKAADAHAAAISACETLRGGLSRKSVKDLKAHLRAADILRTQSIDHAAREIEVRRERLRALKECQEVLRPLTRLVDADTPARIADAAAAVALMVQNPHDPAALQVADLPDPHRLIAELRKRMDAIAKVRSEYEVIFTEEGFEYDHAADLEIVRNSGAIGRIMPAYRRALVRLKAHLASPPDDPTLVVTAYLRARSLYSKADDPDQPTWFPVSEWAGMETDLDAFQNRVRRMSETALKISRLGVALEIWSDSTIIRNATSDARIPSALTQLSDGSLCDAPASISRTIVEFKEWLTEREAAHDVMQAADIGFEVDESMVSAAEKREKAALACVGDEKAARLAISARRIIEACSLPREFRSELLAASDPNEYVTALVAEAAALNEAQDKVDVAERRLRERLDAREGAFDLEDHACLRRQAKAMADHNSEPAFSHRRHLLIAEDRAREAGISTAARELAVSIPRERVGDAVILAFLGDVIRRARRANGAGLADGRESPAAISSRYRSTDGALHEHNALSILRKQVEDAPHLRHPQIRALHDEANSRRKRPKPLRQIIDRAGGAIQQAAPIWFMSPASVAQLLPPGRVDFDLVVIDEASQMRPEHALGSLLRGRQAVIVGDPNQMPPSRLFEKAEADDPFEESNDDGADQVESILDLAFTRLPVRRRLRWHYRSRHPDLISFSNMNYYQNELVVFPSPRVDDPNLGVHSHSIEGRDYAGGINHAEAKAVVDDVFSRMIARPDLTMAVIAMNNPQAELLNRMVEDRALSDPAIRSYIDRHEAGHEPFMVDGLENIQGHERDVVLISTVYAAGANGRASSLLHSPLNRATGHRRLNVLITRARSAVHVFTSLKPGEIPDSPAGHRGIADLREYISYAETRVLKASPLGRTRDPESDFERLVGEAIMNAGFIVDYQIGVDRYRIDIGVSHRDHPWGYIAGIECDGAPWHRGLAVRDRDRIRQMALEDKGWHILRCWSTEWYTQPRREIQRLVAALHERLCGLAGAPERNTATPEPVAELIQEKESDHHVDEQDVADESAVGVPVIGRHDHPDAEPAEIIVSNPEPDPFWIKRKTGSITFFVARKGLEYVLWDAARGGEIGRIHTNRQGEGSQLKTEYLAVLNDGQERRSVNLYEMVRWGQFTTQTGLEAA